MSDPSIAPVQRYIDCWNRRDLDAALECVDPGIELDWSTSIGPMNETFVGHEGIRRFWREMLDPWDEFHIEIAEVIPLGPDVLLTAAAVRGRGRGSGVEVRAGGAMIWKVRDGKIFEARLFQTKEEALAAV
jgi:ketosteroid isomerase-like protein